MMLAVLGLVLSMGIGALVVFMLAPRPQSGYVIALQLAAAFGVGLALTSVTHFVSIQLFGQSDAQLLLLDGALFVALAVAAMVTNRAGPSHDLGVVDDGTELSAPSSAGPATPDVFRLIVLAGAALTCVCAVATSLSYFIGRPHGDWDAWAMWNMRARFLYRGGEDWQLAWAPELSGVRLDYPWFRPLVVARMWTLLGSESTVVPRLMMASLAVCSAVILGTAVARRAGGLMGCVALAVYAAAPVVAKESANQFADLPLSLFFLSAVVAARTAMDAEFGVNRLLALAGLFAGCASWTKNEGLLFTIALVACTAVVMCRKRGMRPGIRSTIVLVAGAAPMLAVVFAAKLSFMWKSDLFEERGVQGMLPLVWDASRWKTLAHWFGELLPEIVSPWLIGLVVVFLLVQRFTQRRDESHMGSAGMYGLVTTAGTIGLVAIGYLFIYITTPHDIGWHMRTSFSRLVLHLWPSVVFILFASGHSPRRRHEQKLTSAAST